MDYQFYQQANNKIKDLVSKFGCGLQIENTPKDIENAILKISKMKKRKMKIKFVDFKKQFEKYDVLAKKFLTVLNNINRL